MQNFYDIDYKIGQDNVQKFGMDIHVPVFPVAAILIICFVGGTLVFPDTADQVFKSSKDWIIDHFDWLFMISANYFIIFFIALAVMPFGKIRLGGDDAKPEFTLLSWFGMLFAAGMGIGLMFWSVAEPVAYFTDWYGTPLDVVPKTPAAAELALGATMFHWGFHAWAIYGIVALSLAFFAFNKGLPLTIRSTFYPIMGRHTWGWPGHIIDIVAVLATIFGLATSLGFGAQQVASGLHALFNVPDGIPTQIAVIFGVTLLAIISVVRGLHGGVKLLSNINMIIALVLFCFVAYAGTFTSMFENFWLLTKGYAQNIIALSDWRDRSDVDFYKGWTVFYWAWWIAWSPFVGMFIARVSKGRTVREFIIAVLLVPTIITGIWMSTFGGLGLEQVTAGVGGLANGITDTSFATFQMLGNLPLSSITTAVGIVLVMVFFVTSSDSGSLVIDSITAGGKLDAPVPQRIFWASMEGLIAAALLFGGGENALSALQTASVVTGLPFVFVLLVMSGSLWMGLHSDHKYLQKGT